MVKNQFLHLKKSLKLPKTHFFLPEKSGFFWLKLQFFSTFFRPQTKRKNVVADLISQARGSAITCFAMAFFWIFGFITYVRNPESDTPEMYCIFIIILGFFGVVIFATYGLMSKRFRNGLRAPKAKYIVQEDTISTISR